MSLCHCVMDTGHCIGGSFVCTTSSSEEDDGGFERDLDIGGDVALSLCYGQALTGTRGYSTTRFSNHYSYPTRKILVLDRVVE